MSKVPGSAPAAVKAREAGLHIGAKLAAFVLLVAGLAIGAFAVWLAFTGIGHGPASGGLFEAMLAGAIALVLVCLLHWRVAALIWARNAAGWSLGLSIGLIGLLLGGLLLSAAIEPQRGFDGGQPAPPSPGHAPAPLDLPLGSGAGVDLTAALFLVPYAIVVVGLLLSRRDRGRDFTA